MSVYISPAALSRKTIPSFFRNRNACMRKILAPLKAAGLDGVKISSGDGSIRRCHPIFAVHVGDYPEQVLVTGVKYGECACCPVPPADLGVYPHQHPYRELEPVLRALEIADDALRAEACLEAGIKPLYKPYWEELPYADPFLSITPDILHQLYQGVVKHLVTWIKTAYSESEIDARARRLPRGDHIRVFTKGISSLSQLTGREHADISRILLGLVIGMPLPDGESAVRLVRAVRAILDFLYLAQYPVHTNDTLDLLDDALARFHDNKQIFVDLGVREGWGIPKLHYLGHYRFFIKRLGTADNFNTEYTERLHIDFAKDAYEATNSKDEFPQMTLWLERREKVIRHERYIAWCQDNRPPLPSSNITNNVPTDRLQMTLHPSKKAVSFASLQTDYGAPFFEDALARFIVKHRHPEFTDAQIEDASDGIIFPFK